MVCVCECREGAPYLELRAAADALHTQLVWGVRMSTCVCVCEREMRVVCVYVNAERVPPSLSCVQQRMPYTHS